MQSGFTKPHVCVRMITGYIWKIFVVLLVISMVPCPVSSIRDAPLSFSNELSAILNGPSMHGKKVPRMRAKRNIGDVGLDYDPAGFDSLYPDDGCLSHHYDIASLYEELYKGPVCDIIDARNSLDTLRDLENCTIVNGFVQLVFMHEITEEDLKNYRFPKLRVITHYLLVFRMFNLRTLRHMFPNLAVIGGRELFKDYSLVIYENPHMTEIGLKNLQVIKRGGVRIQKNSNLCYLNTIDWERLSKGTGNVKLSENVIMDNKDPEQCVDQCGDACSPVAGKKYCWGMRLCQKQLCPDECKHACKNGRCNNCHPQCLAGCSRPNDPTACTACRSKYHNGTCVDECPKNSYVIHEWLCITAKQCMLHDWTFYGNRCQLQCPSGYQVKVENCMRICEKCDFDCRKVCHGDHEINDFYSLASVETCKEISGSLIFSINGGSEVVKELDRVFKDLEVIGSLVVRRSFPLISLSFLRNLKQITGARLEQDMYSVYVLDNQNLKELFNVTKSKLKIDKGKSFFHLNPRLCMQKIKEIRDLTPLVEDDKDISENTNGERATCNMTKIKILGIHPYDMDRTIMRIWWENTVVKDQRTLIGYQVLYKESPRRNATKFEGVDACGRNSWTIVDKAKTKDDYISVHTILTDDLNSTVTTEMKPGRTFKLLSELKPYTLYALYIHAYTTSTAKLGAESDIHYFMTEPAEPTKPEKLKADALNSSSITVKWNPPLSPNGVMSHYIVTWRRQREEDLADVRSMDSCKNPFVYVRSSTSSKDSKHDEDMMDKGATKPSTSDGQCCSCDTNILHEIEKEAKDSVDFENYLHDYIFLTREEEMPDTIHRTILNSSNEPMSYETPAMRYRRALGSAFSSNATSTPINRRFSGLNHSVAPIPDTKPTSPPTPLEYSWKRVVVNGTSVNLTGLHHFSEYDIMVYACNNASDPRSRTDLNYKIRDENKMDHSYTDCSTAAMTSKRTAHSVHVDVIPPGSLNVTTKQVEVKGEIKEVTEFVWKMPEDPNAYVRKFTIEINSTEGEHELKCVHVDETVKDVISYTLKTGAIGPGRYTARIRPITLAGEGNWTEPVAIELHDLNDAGPSKTIIIVLSIFTAICIVALVAGLYYYKTRQKPIDGSIIYDVNPEYSRYVYTPDEYEIDFEKVTIQEEIGHGNFGKVFAGLAKGVVKGQAETNVAIKKLHENADPARRFEFLKEASMMKAFNAHHVVRLLGVVSQVGDPMVIMEFMEGGDLKSFLRSRREDSEENSLTLPPPTLQEKLQMAAEIADGMAYLADNKFVHRDLAARNCLVGENGTVKIGDFGLTRDIYETDYYRKESRGFLPIRWMAPESLKDGVFDSRSDVWSYGVVLWELATLAEQPYQGQQHDEVTRFVIDGGYMERPRECPKRLYDLMSICWQYNPTMRPIFLEIVQSLYGDVSEEFKQCCFYGKNREVNSDVEESEANFLLPSEHPVSYIHNEMTATPSPGHNYSSNHIHVAQGPAGDGVIRHRENNRTGQLLGGPAIYDHDEKRGLLAPDPVLVVTHRDESSDPLSGDSRSPNTTSTTAMTPPSSGEGAENKEKRYSSDSYYENDFEDDTPVLPPKPGKGSYPSPGDSGTFSTTKKAPRELFEVDLRLPFAHHNGGHKRRKSRDMEIEIEQESGVGEDQWGNSSSASVSTPTTPTEAIILTPKNGGLDDRFVKFLRPPGPTSSC